MEKIIEIEGMPIIPQEERNTRQGSAEKQREPRAVLLGH